MKFKRETLDWDAERISILFNLFHVSYRVAIIDTGRTTVDSFSRILPYKCFHRRVFPITLRFAELKRA